MRLIIFTMLVLLSSIANANTICEQVAGEDNLIIVYDSESPDRCLLKTRGGDILTLNDYYSYRINSNIQQRQQQQKLQDQIKQQNLEAEQKEEQLRIQKQEDVVKQKEEQLRLEQQQREELNQKLSQ